MSAQQEFRVRETPMSVWDASSQHRQVTTIPGSTPISCIRKSAARRLGASFGVDVDAVSASSGGVWPLVQLLVLLWCR